MKTRQIYIAGESHAGHYIPSMVSFIFEKNKGGKDIILDIKGILIGNGWIDPSLQYSAAEFAHSHGLITSLQKNRLDSMEKSCIKNIEKGKLNTKICFDLLDDIVANSGVKGSTRVNMYDIREFVYSPNPYPPNHELVESYMNQQDVRAALNALHSPLKFVECADPPYFALSHQDGKSIVPEITSLLNSGLDILFFSGQYDMICHHIGTEKVLDKLKWSGQKEWLNTKPGIWTVEGKTAGYIRSYLNLKYLLVINTGHMVPLNNPIAALEMLSKFINKKDFSSGVSKIQPLFQEDTKLCDSNKKEISLIESTDKPPERSVILQYRSPLPVDSGVYIYLLAQGNFVVSTIYNGLSTSLDKEKVKISHVYGSLGEKMSEVFISGLKNGSPVIISIEDIDASSHALINITPGSFLKDKLQCCGKGVCSFDSPNSLTKCNYTSFIHCKSISSCSIGIKVNLIKESISFYTSETSNKYKHLITRALKSDLSYLADGLNEITKIEVDIITPNLENSKNDYQVKLYISSAKASIIKFIHKFESALLDNQSFLRNSFAGRYLDPNYNYFLSKPEKITEFQSFDKYCSLFENQEMLFLSSFVNLNNFLFILIFAFLLYLTFKFYGKAILRNTQHSNYKPRRFAIR